MTILAFIAGMIVGVIGLAFVILIRAAHAIAQGFETGGTP